MSGERNSDRFDRCRDTEMRIVVDACVWHSAFVRHALRHLALAGLFDMRWTSTIEQEWIKSVRRVRPDIPLATLLASRDRFRVEFPAGLVTSNRSTPIPHGLPDATDLHVVRAAVSCGAKLICTVDRKGFPTAALGPIGISAISPDELLCQLLSDRPRNCIAALNTHRSALNAPIHSWREYANALRRCGMSASADQLASRRLPDR